MHFFLLDHTHITWCPPLCTAPLPYALHGKSLQLPQRQALNSALLVWAVPVQRVLVLTTWRDKSLGCGVAHQQLPRSSTSKIHKLVGNPSCKPPRGPRRVVLLGSRVWRERHWGGRLVLVSACLTVSPLITGGQAYTHTHTTWCFC